MNSMKGGITSHFKQQRSGAARTSGQKQEVAPPALPAAAEAVPQVPQQEAEAEALLRQFDLASKYGPCTGITRLERWERAVKLGMDPPAEVRALILRYGVDSTHNRDVFFHPF